MKIEVTMSYSKKAIVFRMIAPFTRNKFRWREKVMWKITHKLVKKYWNPYYPIHTNWIDDTSGEMHQYYYGDTEPRYHEYIPIKFRVM
ncbi:MAG: hypothetical protein ACYDAO_04445 [Thermoplasmataceae archaeon]